MGLALIKMIVKVMLGFVMLLFVNNPYSPLSIPIVINGESGWYPIFTEGFVLNYQIIFTYLVLLSIGTAIGEYLLYSNSKYWAVIDDVAGIIGLVVIRSIPQEAFNLPAFLAERYNHSLFYGILSILILLTMIGAILNLFNLVATTLKQTSKQK